MEGSLKHESMPISCWSSVLLVETTMTLKIPEILGRFNTWSFNKNGNIKAQPTLSYTNDTFCQAIELTGHLKDIPEFYLNLLPPQQPWHNQSLKDWGDKTTRKDEEHLSLLQSKSRMMTPPPTHTHTYWANQYSGRRPQGPRYQVKVHPAMRLKTSRHPL